MKKICCFGEILMRMSPAADWIQKNSIQVYIGGAESNVASALSNWGLPVKYITAMPDNYIGKDIEHYLQSKNIDTSAIAWQGSRIGLYYMEQGKDLKNEGVIYDRFHSSFYELQPGDINWEEVLEDVQWLHFSAISPALNENAVAVCKELLMIAEQKGITISVDLNYRAKLWKYGKQPIEVMPGLVQHCEVVMGNIWSAHDLLGTAIDSGIHHKNSKEAYLQHATQTANEIKKLFPKVKTVANTFRFDHNKGVKYFTTLDITSGQYVSSEYSPDEVIDKAGSGDGFMAGLIYGLANNHAPQQLIEFASEAAVRKLLERGDTIGHLLKKNA